jgi:uncharacterized membrane protein
MVQIFNTRLGKVAENYLRLLHTSVTRTSVRKDINESPHYPSLLSLSATFNKYNISNNAFEVSKEELTRFEPPFVAFMNMPNTGTDFVLVTEITDESVSYLFASSRKSKMDKEEFLRRYQNVVWIAEADEQSGEPDYNKKRKKEKLLRIKKMAWYIGLVALLFILFTMNIPVRDHILFFSILILKLAGALTAVMLVIYDADPKNDFVKSLCNAGTQMNCDAVLTSKAARIMGISWAEIGLLYFSGTGLWLLFAGLSFVDKATLLSIGGVLASPYIVFSIYYQSQVIKQWCPLCLTVQGILFLELIWSIINLRSLESLSAFTGLLDPMEILAIIFCILFPMVFWFAIKPLLTMANKASFYQSAYKRLQHNPDIFMSLLKQQAQAPEHWQNLGITIGNPNAVNQIIKVCNPYCGPCAKAHPELEELVKLNSNVQIKIIFTAKNTETDRGAPVVKHLLAVASQGNPAKTQKALDDWYLGEPKDYELFSVKYPLNAELVQQDNKIEAMSQWCDQAQITHTPTIFVNGFRLPEIYGIEELKSIF